MRRILGAALFIVCLADAGASEPVACPPAERGAVEAALDRAAEAAGVERKLLGALAGVESHFDSGARSPRGALGLLQLMPDTAAELGVKDRCDVNENARGGAVYLGRLVAEFGNPWLAVAAYNAGPARIYEHKGVPPFAETVRHTARVMNLYFGLDRDLGRAGKGGGAKAQLVAARASAPPQSADGKSAQFIQGQVMEIER